LLARRGLYDPQPSPELRFVSYLGALLLLAALVIGTPQSYPVPGAALPVCGRSA